MKSKFKNLNFEAFGVLSRDEKTKVVGGYIPGMPSYVTVGQVYVSGGGSGVTLGACVSWVSNGTMTFVNCPPQPIKDNLPRVFHW